jgi:hypothetical protein
MGLGHYILKDGEPVEVDLLTWARSFGQADRRVAFTKVNGYEVFTVFLGLDHSFGGGRPLLFETMVFGEGPMQGQMDRYSTLEEAMHGHERMVATVSAEG